MNKYFITISLFLLMSSDDAWAIAFRCFYPTGVTTASPNDEYEISKNNGLGDNAMFFSDVNLENGNATVIGNQGSDKATAMLFGNKLHFFERTAVGNLVTTTIYLTEDRKGKYESVMSRHIGVLGKSVNSQYYGHCWRWD